VCSQVYDHTSIVQFMERRFGVHEPQISPWRRAVCGDLTAMFDFAHPNSAGVSLPSTSGYAPADHNRHPDYKPTVPANQTLPVQEPGLRAARPLPYDLGADASIEQARLKVTFVNRGEAGATFYVTSSSIAGAPWTYTVEAGRDLTADWGLQSAYDLSVHGPNGFFRQMRGSGASAAPQISARQAGRSGQLQLTLRNDIDIPVQLTVTDAYGTHAPKMFALRPHAAATDVLDLEASNGWYDVTVVSAQDGAFLRRLAGHVETGRPSTSDPAIMTG
jgi:phospholipase C